MKSSASLRQIMADRDDNGMAVPVNVRPEDLPGWLAAANKACNCDGIVITVPLKVPCMDFCERVSARAIAAGAVNIMIRDGGDWVSDATE